MAEALERNERARRNMVSDVAHELRTPLTNIRVQIEAAQDGVVAADAKFLGSIDEEAATLARLVDDLQQLSLAEAGELRLELAEVRVAEIVDARRGLAPQVVPVDVPDDLSRPRRRAAHRAGRAKSREQRARARAEPSRGRPPRA